MKRSLQEYVELVVFGLVALLVGTGLLWLTGWALSLGGVALRWVAGLLWTLLRFIVPVAIAGGLVYFLVKAAQDRQPRPAAAGTPVSAPPPPAPAPATSGGDVTPATPPSTVSDSSAPGPAAAAGDPSATAAPGSAADDASAASQAEPSGDQANEDERA